MIRSLSASALLIALGTASPAAGQSLEDDFWIELSGYYPAIDTSVRADSADGTVGTEIDFEDDFDFGERELLPAFFAGARLGDGFSIGAEYYALDRSSSATLTRTITFDDVTYPVNAEVSGNSTRTSTVS